MSDKSPHRSTRELQLLISEFVERKQLSVPVAYRCLDLVCEVGELAKELLNGTEYGNREFHQSPAWRDEFGDVLFAVFCLANATEVDIELALVSALEKYSERMQRTGSPASSAST